MENKKQLLEDYLNHLQIAGMDDNTQLSEHTIRTRKIAITQLLNAFDNPLEVTTAQLRDWLLSFKGVAWKKASTYIRKIDYIKYFYRFLLSEGRIDHDPAAGLKYPRRPKNYERIGFTAIQLKRVVDIVESPNMPLLNKVVFYTLITSGLRVSELLSIRKKNINFSNRMIYIPREDNKGKKVDKRVPFSTKAKEYIERYISEDFGSQSEYLFHKLNGERMNTRDIYRITEGIIANAFPREDEWDKPMGPHILRHTFCFLWLESEGDRSALQHIMGWTSQREIEVYAKACGLSMDFVNRQSKKVQRVFKKIHKI